MGLVDYSDSESDSEPVTKPAPSPPLPPSQPAPVSGGKKPFQKVVDRSKPGKILVNLPQDVSGDESKTTEGGGDEPPAKRARIAGRGGGGAFSGFNALLPPPKNAGKPAVASNSRRAAPRPGIHLKTGAAPGFSREVDGDGEGRGGAEGIDATTSTPPQPSIPAEQKPAEEVKLVGKPLMFKPLSVSRKPAKKNAAKSAKAAAVSTPAAPTSRAKNEEKPHPKDEAAAAPPAKKQKISLFSISDEPPPDKMVEDAPGSNGIYEPMFNNNEVSSSTTTAEFAAYDAQYAYPSSLASGTSAAAAAAAATTTQQPDSLDAIAASMNLSASARRELFGRQRGGAADVSSARVLSFDTGREYAHNEQLRASGDQQLQQTYNPVRAIAPGKHSLRQLVTQAQNQREALEESFARGKSNRHEAGTKYGWR